ncbi:MAG: hypothetical protein FJZ43_01930 [Candidatus Staskawiczbacteria bacterium]|nr:hypothetical protein [Candidatus Staskawiczbacteria bacterium]
MKIEEVKQFFGLNKRIAVVAGGLAVCFIVLGFFNLALVLAIGFVFILLIILFSLLFYLNIRDKNVYIVALVVFLIHMVFAMVFYVLNYHTSIRIFGGGADFDLYQNNAIEFANRLRHGIFSVEGLYLRHYFAIIMGFIYFITIPDPVVGQMFTVFTSVCSAVLLYLLIVEIGGSRKWAYWITIISSFYASYAIFGSVLLKEIFVIPLILLSLLILIKLFKKFSLVYFIWLFIVITAIIHFRFYIGFALMFTFVICCFLISKMSLRNKVGLSIIIGLAPAIMGFGYFGWIPINQYLALDQIRILRDVIYAPVSPEDAQKLIDEKNEVNQNNDKTAGFSEEVKKDSNKKVDFLSEGFSEDTNTTVDFFKERKKANAEFKTLEGRPLTPEEIAKTSGTSSSFSVKSETNNPFMFLVNYGISFLYSFFGPFPWQIKEARQISAFAEVIPWWVIFVSILYGVYKSIQNEGVKKFWGKYMYALPMVIFGIISIGVISLFINNYGIIMRIRIPVLLSFLAILSFNPIFFEDTFLLFSRLLKWKNKL